MGKDGGQIWEKGLTNLENELHSQVSIQNENLLTLGGRNAITKKKERIEDRKECGKKAKLG